MLLIPIPVQSATNLWSGASCPWWAAAVSLFDNRFKKTHLFTWFPPASASVAAAGSAFDTENLDDQLEGCVWFLFQSSPFSHRSLLSRSFLSLMCRSRMLPLCSMVWMRGLRPLTPPWLIQNSLSVYRERRRRLSRHPDWSTDTAFSGNLSGEIVIRVIRQGSPPHENAWFLVYFTF